MAGFAALAKAGFDPYGSAPMQGPFYMDAVITPHRSLSRRGLIVLISVMTAINVAAAILFISLGAGPVPIFLGLYLAAVIIAFGASHRAANRNERIQVTAAEVRILLETPQGARTIWVSPTVFTQVALMGEAEDRTDLRVRLSGRELAVAQSLSRRERLDFAKALDRAIMRARAGRVLT
jgi:uncharacterized membrane protein